IFSFIITALCGACFGVKRPRYHLFIWALFICDISRNIWIFNNYVHVDYYAYGSRCWLGFLTNAVSTVAKGIIPPEGRGEGLGFFGLSGNLALAFGPAPGLKLGDHGSFKTLFLIC